MEKQQLKLIVKESERKGALGLPYKDYYLVKGDAFCRVRLVFRSDEAVFLSFLSAE